MTGGRWREPKACATVGETAPGPAKRQRGAGDGPQSLREKCFYLHRMVGARVCRFEVIEYLASKRARGEDVRKGARRVRFAAGSDGRGEKRARK